MSLPEVREHYRRLSLKHGEIQPALEVSVSELGYILLDRKQYDQAIEAFSFNVRRSPQSDYRNIGRKEQKPPFAGLSGRPVSPAKKNGKMNSEFQEIHQDEKMVPLMVQPFKPA